MFRYIRYDRFNVSMEQTTLDKMNDSLAIGMINSDAAAILHEGWNMIGEFTNSHGHIGYEKFGGGEREEILKLFIEDIHKKIFYPEKKR